MSNTPALYNELSDPAKHAAYFDEDYYERAPETGKGHYQDYHWQPRRSFSEALAIINVLELSQWARVLDVGCAKGYLVRALQVLELNASGCDVSEYAIQCSVGKPLRYTYLATQEFWVPADVGPVERRVRYDAAIARDVLEHNTRENCLALLKNIMRVTNRFLACIPLGDDGKFRIPSYHRDKSHLLIENERWWWELLDEAGWHVERWMYHLPGLKDNWFQTHPKGNMICIMRPLYPKT